MRLVKPCALTFAAVAILLGGSPEPVDAQTRLERGTGLEHVPRIGVGYVANAPSIFTGLAAWGVFDVLGGLGLYVDTKYDFDTPAEESDFVSDLTLAEVEAAPGQTFHFDESGWWSANVALVRPVSPELMLYLGGGYAHEDRYLRYADPTEQVVEGQQGWYWVHDAEASGARLNVLGGAFFRLGQNLVLQFGFDTKPSGLSVGASYTVGLR